MLVVPDPTEPNARSVAAAAKPKLYKAPVFDEPVPALYVVRDEYHPGRVVLSVHTMLVPVAARLSKFSVNAVSSAVMLPELWPMGGVA